MSAPTVALAKQSLHKLLRDRAVVRCALLCANLWLSQMALALQPDALIVQYGHTVFRIRDGTPPSRPHAIAQTADGYLWIATRTGLMRFDGVRFESKPITAPIPDSFLLPGSHTLLGSRDGSLWIAGSHELDRWHDGTLSRYDLGRGSAAELIEDPDGTVWSSIAVKGGPERICHIAGDSMRCYERRDGFDIGHEDCCQPFGLAKDADGSVWIGSDRALTHWRPGEPAQNFEPAALRHNQYQMGVSAVAVDDKTIWVGTAVPGPEGGLQQFIAGRWHSVISPGFDSSELIVSALYLDGHHALWVGTLTSGLYRLHNGKVQHYGAGDGLSSDTVYAVFEDHEGGLWVATSEGIDHFRDLRVRTYSSREGLKSHEVDSLLARRDGSIWIGTGFGLNVLRDGALTSVGKREGLPGQQVTSMLEDRFGNVWIGIDDRLNLYRDRKFESITAAGRNIGLITDMAEDVNGDVWLQARSGGRTLMQIHQQQIYRQYRTPEIPDGNTVVADPDGGLWLGLLTGDLGHFRDGKVEVVSLRTLRPNGIKPLIDQLSVDAKGRVLGSTDYGLVGWSDGQLRLMTVANGLPCPSLYSFVFDNEGNLWLSSRCGYIRITARDLSQWWGDDRATVHAWLSDTLDGADADIVGFRGALRAAGGALLFGSQSGLQVIDPEHLPFNTKPPPVDIADVIADHRLHRAAERIDLPALTRDLQIDYTALSMTLPQKVRFQYRLDGHDMEWQDAGTRRQAFYTDLPPGSYRFHVKASNNDGVWNDAGASIGFVIPVAYYQSHWFRLLMLAGIVLAVWLIFLWRIREAKERVRSRLEERLVERERIARELHDTFLQSVQGLVLNFQSATERLSQSEPARELLERALDRADRVLGEGRDRVSELRGAMPVAGDIPAVLSQMGKEVADRMGVIFNMTVEGTPRKVHPVVGDEIRWIIGEALANATNHARPRQIDLDITYGKRALSVRVNDNGCGFDVAAVDVKFPDRHWGLRGMYERARKIRGQLEVTSRLRAGTAVELMVPAKVAYRRQQQSHIGPSLLWRRRTRAGA